MNSKELKSIAEAYAKMNIRGNDSEEQKKRLEKKRGMKLDDHPQFKKEDLEQIDEKGMNPGFKAYLEKQKKKGGDKEEGDAPKGGGKPDFIDLDKDGDKKESMKKAAQDKKKGMGEQVHLNDISKTYLDQVANNGDEVVDEALTGQRQMRARDMKGTPYQKGGGKRTARDNKTLHNLATRNEGPGTPGYEKKSTGGKGGKKFAGYGDQGAGNKAARRAGNEPMRGNRDPRNEELEATGLFSEKEIAAIEEAMSSYDKNRKRAAQRAADRNAARAAGKTGVVPGVGYVSPRKEKESYTDEKGTERHKSGAKMP
tara:strand:+ start:96 stop:1031 length:936 start_codon:yes stop_codon:yes gene_type:complete